jgi:hypothetical protein
VSGNPGSPVALAEQAGPVSLVGYDPHLAIWMTMAGWDLEPVAGFEPTTSGLQNRCSTN